MRDSQVMNGWLAKYRKYITRKITSQSRGSIYHSCLSLKCCQLHHRSNFREANTNSAYIYFLFCKTIQLWLWIWNALHVSAHQANITQWQGQRPGKMGRGCICCYCHSYPLAHPPLIRCLDNCDLDTHCWWSDITQTEACFSPRYSQGTL